MSFVELFNDHSETRVAAVCDTDFARAETVAADLDIERSYRDFESFIRSDFDIAVIATPFPLHVEHVIKALEQGKHVLSEVPPAYTVNEAKQLVRAVRKHSNRKYMMAANYNYIHFIREWIQRVRGGAVGAITYAEVEYIHHIPSLLKTPDGSATWRTNLPPIMYCMHDLGPIITMLGERLVDATGFSTGARISPENGTVDMQLGVFHSESGAVIKLLVGFSHERGRDHHFISVYGTKGCIENSRWNPNTEGYVHFKDAPATPSLTPAQITINDPHAPEEANKGGHGTSEYYLIRDFISSIQNNTKPPIDVYTALDFGLPGICAEQSIRAGGKKINIPDPRTW